MADKKLNIGDEIIVERNVEAEVPYELVKVIGVNGLNRLYTRNIRNDSGVANKKMNIAKQKAKEAEEALKAAETAKAKVKEE